MFSFSPSFSFPSRYPLSHWDVFFLAFFVSLSFSLKDIHCPTEMFSFSPSFSFTSRYPLSHWDVFFLRPSFSFTSRYPLSHWDVFFHAFFQFHFKISTVPLRCFLSRLLSVSLQDIHCPTEMFSFSPSFSFTSRYPLSHWDVFFHAFFQFHFKISTVSLRCFLSVSPSFSFSFTSRYPLSHWDVFFLTFFQFHFKISTVPLRCFLSRLLSVSLQNIHCPTEMFSFSPSFSFPSRYPLSHWDVFFHAFFQFHFKISTVPLRCFLSRLLSVSLQDIHCPTEMFSFRPSFSFTSRYPLSHWDVFFLAFFQCFLSLQDIHCPTEMFSFSLSFSFPSRYPLSHWDVFFLAFFQFHLKISTVPLRCFLSGLLSVSLQDIHCPTEMFSFSPSFSFTSKYPLSHWDVFFLAFFQFHFKISTVPLRCFLSGLLSVSLQDIHCPTEMFSFSPSFSFTSRYPLSHWDVFFLTFFQFPFKISTVPLRCFLSRRLSVSLKDIHCPTEMFSFSPSFSFTSRYPLSHWDVFFLAFFQFHLKISTVPLRCFLSRILSVSLHDIHSPTEMFSFSPSFSFTSRYPLSHWDVFFLTFFQFPFKISTVSLRCFLSRRLSVSLQDIHCPTEMFSFSPSFSFTSRYPLSHWDVFFLAFFQFHYKISTVPLRCFLSCLLSVSLQDIHCPTDIFSFSPSFNFTSRYPLSHWDVFFHAVFQFHFKISTVPLRCFLSGLLSVSLQDIHCPTEMFSFSPSFSFTSRYPLSHWDVFFQAFFQFHFKISTVPLRCFLSRLLSVSLHDIHCPTEMFPFWPSFSFTTRYPLSHWDIFFLAFFQFHFKISTVPLRCFLSGLLSVSLQDIHCPTEMFSFSPSFSFTSRYPLSHWDVFFHAVFQFHLKISTVPLRCFLSRLLSVSLQDIHCPTEMFSFSLSFSFTSRYPLSHWDVFFLAFFQFHFKIYWDFPYQIFFIPYHLFISICSAWHFSGEKNL